MTLYASSSDSALILSKGLHAEQRAGDADPPLVVPGVETVDCTSIDFNFMGHSYYSGNVNVLSDLFALLKENKSADQRPWLSQVGAQTGPSHWEFNNNGPMMLWTWHFDDNTALR